MKILFFRGSFSCNGETFHDGLVTWCHLNSDENIESIETARELVLRTRISNEKVVLVPFSGLDVNAATMNFDEAKNLFKKFSKSITGPLVVIPFKAASKLYLHVEDPEAFVEFNKA